MSPADFDSFFTAATGHAPFNYQRRLAEGNGKEFNRSLLINVPTGMGKTAAVVLAWLWNHIGQPDKFQQDRWPRRLVYCLPMRTLVEQTDRYVVNWLSNLAEKRSNPELEWLDQHSPVILMGGVEDEKTKEQWDLWPEKMCIVIGTQDMLLSRALNRGYAMSRYRWPIHFGLLNNDCLWVMDEVQLMGPGLWTSGQLDWMRQERFGTTARCWTWWMSATNSAGFLDTSDRKHTQLPEHLPFDPEEMPPSLRDARRPVELWSPAAAQKKGRAKKESSLALENELTSSLAIAIVAEHVRGTLSLVVCNTVKLAQTLHAELASLNRNGADLILLTSRFRKLDRQASENMLINFERARKTGIRDESPGLICVATQVVEAGVDVSACRLWTEIAPWPSLVQRLGRLNRDGQVNGRARAFFFELAARAGKSKSGPVAGPYRAEAVESGRIITRAIVEICRNNPGLSALDTLAELRKTEKIAKEIEAALQPSPQPFPRAIDVHGLFSTEPDVFGGFTEISQFIRGEDPQSDVAVFWREFDSAKPLPDGDDLDGPAYGHEEGCAVPIRHFREFLGEKGYGFVWDDRKSIWQERRAGEIYPGMVVMLPRRGGGYSVSRGWNGYPLDRIDAAPPPGPFYESFRADPFSERGEWVTLTDHLADVRREAEGIATDLQLPDLLRRSLNTAAEHHDIGKALKQWQNKLPHPVPDGTGLWAKAPYLFAVRPDKANFDATHVESVLLSAGVRFRRVPAEQGSRLADCCLWHTSVKVNDTAERKWLSEMRRIAGVRAAWMVPFRPGLRHEAASALALWHQYFHECAGFLGLAIYLTAAHHGKVRTVLTARTRQGDDVCGIPRDASVLPWSSGLRLDFSCASDGADGEFSPDGTAFVCTSPGWTALIADLLGGWQQRPERPTLLALRHGSEPFHLGPFALAYLESLIRCADVRASQRPSHSRDV